MPKQQLSDAIRSKRVPVMVDAETYKKVKAYSDVTGVPVARVINEAISDFSETSLQVRLEALQAGKQQTNIISIESAKAIGASNLA